MKDKDGVMIIDLENGCKMNQHDFLELLETDEHTGGPLRNNPTRLHTLKSQHFNFILSDKSNLTKQYAVRPIVRHVVQLLIQNSNKEVLVKTTVNEKSRFPIYYDSGYITADDIFPPKKDALDKLIECCLYSCGFIWRVGYV